jgi:eukaryotic-like serine/threonine-protein kinase
MPLAPGARAGETAVFTSQRQTGVIAGRFFLGKYRVESLLGEGGMGKAYLARQIDTGRQVVVKVLHDHIAAQPRFRESFQQEMDFMARFQHPNVVALYESSSADPHGLCIVMEYIPGVALDQVLQQHGRLPPDRVGRLLGQLCLALQAAHTAGIIHRDLKPANLMVIHPGSVREQLKVMDFGLAKLGTALYIPVERLANPNNFFQACGTPDYICPEQVRGDELDYRSDLYSVGVILFEMLTGRLPFVHSDIQHLMLAHARDPVPTFAQLGVKNLPSGIEAVVRSCLEKFPNERPKTARELVEWYEKALGRKITRPEDWNQALPSPPPAPAGSRTVPRLPESQAVVQELEAWMPEKIAVVKLQGFVNDNGGQVVESVPGLIRVRLPLPTEAPQPSGVLGLLGLGRKPAAPPPPPGLEMELHMEKRDPNQGRLHITVILRPAGSRRQAVEAGWRRRCETLQRELKAYLMG